MLRELQNATCEIFFTHIPQHSFVACWTVQFDFKFREFSYEIPRIDVSYRRMIFSLSLVAIRGWGRQHSRHALREPLWNRGKAYLARKSRDCPARSGMLRMDCSSANGGGGGEGNVSEAQGEWYACEPLQYLFHIGHRWFSFPWEQHRDRKPKANTITCDTFVFDIENPVVTIIDEKFSSLYSTILFYVIIYA